MSNFNCNKCGTAIIDTERGYVTSCEHFQAEDVNKFRSKYIDTTCSCHAGKICESHKEEVLRKMNDFAKSQVDIPEEFRDALTNWNYEDIQ